MTAVGSFLQTRAKGGEWLVRIENIDPGREVVGAGDGILAELERLGLHWDGPVIWQHTRREAHRAALEELRRDGFLYRCRCSRRLTGSGPYPGTCRELELPATTPGTWRLRVPDSMLAVEDLVQGPYRQQLATACGDFVAWRADDWPAYHLAVVVDDGWQGITEVVRGADLLDSTPRQCWLQSCLGLPQPSYAHLPLALEPTGAKLSKDVGSAPVRGTPAGTLLTEALRFLGLAAPPDLAAASTADILAWGLAHWRLEKVPRQSRVVEPVPPGRPSRPP